MEEQKCFCHFNGYEVKDAKARQEIENINNDITTINNDITTINNDITTINNDITTINNKINHKNMIIIGDSYGASSSSWIDLLGSKLGNNYYKFAVGGAGFSYVGSLGKNFLMILQDNIDKITDKNSITSILVGGGYNDHTQTFEQIQTAIREFVTYCNSNFPNAKIYIALLGFNTNYTSDGATVRKAIAEVVYPAYSFNYNIENAPIFIENSQFIMHNVNYTGEDGIHPNETGNYKIASSLFNYFNGNNLTVTQPYTVEYLNINNKDYAYTTFIENNLSTIRIAANTFTLNNITLTAGSTNDDKNLLGTFTKNVLFPNLSGDLSFPCTVAMHYLKDGVDTTQIINGQLYFGYDGNLYFMFQDFENGLFKSYTNVTSLRILTYTSKTVSTLLN